MAATICGAMVAKFTTSPAFSDVATSQSPWVNMTPEEPGKVLPFVVMTHEGLGNIEFSTEEPYQELHLFTFIVYAGGQTPLQSAEAIALKIKQTFDPLVAQALASAALPVTGSKTRSCTRTDYRIDMEGKDINGDNVYSVLLPYEVWITSTVGTS